MQSSTWLCQTCANEFPATENAPAMCPICSDERQYIPVSGQSWKRTTDLETTHSNEIKELEPGLFGIGVTPHFGIGQITFFIPHPDGGILWDGIPFISDETVDWINSLGGVKTMVMSHPHLYAAMNTVSEKLGNPTILLPKADKDWIMHQGPNVQFFDGAAHTLNDQVSVRVTGGHFDGSAFLHWTGDSKSEGVVLTGDTIYVADDHQHVSFLYSTPNRVPLGLNPVRRIVAATEAVKFERIYSSWWDSVIKKDAKQAIANSEARWKRLLSAP